MPRREIGTVGRVVIAYDGSPPATRALHHFASLGGCWNPEVRIVAAMKADEGLPPLTSAQRYLEGYGYQKVKVDQVDKSIIEAFQDDYVDWADLAVLGSSSKSLFEDLMVGSLPKALILERKIPLLINT
ncbi:MAG: universal stress protein [Verrucomicrobiales bacterium]|nr:universal stress protein [Verrucomicrobiales bacterium]